MCEFEISNEPCSEIKRIKLDAGKTTFRSCGLLNISNANRAQNKVSRAKTRGWVKIETEITHVMGIKPLIYYYILFIKVLSPKQLADESGIKEYIKQIDI